MQPIPILFLGDSPELMTGLGRIGRDIASLLVTMPEYRVGFLGRGGTGSRQLPFLQYHFDEVRQWGEGVIERVWNDFAGKEKGIIFTIWDASRLDWFALPEFLPESDLKDFLRGSRFERWGYFPVDSMGPRGRQTGQVREIVKRYDKVLAYTPYGAEQLRDGTDKVIDWLPHGITPVFHPIQPDIADAESRTGDDVKIIEIACVMTNQARKDWGLAMEIMTLLPTNYRLYAHIDVPDRYWNIHALIDDFGLQARVRVTYGGVDDRRLAHLYQSSDVTILPSLGEGFGYPIVESLACGTPVVMGDYAIGAVSTLGSEIFGAVSTIVPVTLRLDTKWNCYRPVYRALDWIEPIKAAATVNQEQRHQISGLVNHLQWERLWTGSWVKWWKEQANGWHTRHMRELKKTMPSRSVSV